ncbi:apoptosis-associated speck-like protein containing a CARD isoform 1-T2 [Pholidichthys leucotaenia]
MKRRSWKRMARASSSGSPTTSAGAAAGNPPADREHFVDQHRRKLIQRVTNVMPILDELSHLKVLSKEKYEEIQKTSTDQAKMRLLYSGPLSAGGKIAKDAFYECLEELEPYLVSDLSGDPALV